MHEVLVNRLGGISLRRKSVVRITDRPDMTLDVYRGRKTTQHNNSSNKNNNLSYTFVEIFLTKLFGKKEKREKERLQHVICKEKDK